MNPSAEQTGTAAGPASKEAGPPVLNVRNLHVEFDTDQGLVHAVNGVSLSVLPGETLALVGESGSGKTVTAEAILGIVDCPPGLVRVAEMSWEGQSLLSMGSRERRKLRGQAFSLVFQDALTALNPGFTVGSQIAEMFRVHRGATRRAAWREAVNLLKRVGIPAAEERARAYPHQFSGGMRQRAMIAIAIALRPKLLIADEPTTALDVTVQAQVMELLKRIQLEDGMSMIFISHDLDLVAEYSDRIAVMYAGKVVETGSVSDVYRRPSHPYTRALISSRPAIDGAGQRLLPIEGLPPRLIELPVGCSFAPRCTRAMAVCSNVDPSDTTVAPGHKTSCHLVGQAATQAVE